MSKFFKTAEDIVQTATEVFDKTGLKDSGVKLKVMSITKSKDIVKATKASAVTEYLTRENDIIQLVIYETAFDRLTDKQKEILLEGAFSNVSYDLDKERLIVDNSQYGELFRMRKKYGNDYPDLLETAALLVEGIEEEEKEAKLREKELKKSAKKDL
jgi:hypothetical protein